MTNFYEKKYCNNLGNRLFGPHNRKQYKNNDKIKSEKMYSKKEF